MNQREAGKNLLESLADLVNASTVYNGEVTNNELLKAILIVLKQIEKKLDNLT